MDYQDNESTIVSYHIQHCCILYDINTVFARMIVPWKIHIFFCLWQSNATLQAEGDAGGFMSDSTNADTSSVVSTQSSVSTRSSRSGLTRQGDLSQIAINKMFNGRYVIHFKIRFSCQYHLYVQHQHSGR